MGPAPKPPDPLGRPPKRGYQHSKFPVTAGTTMEPVGDYRSNIDVSSPFKQALLDKIADVQMPQQTRSSGTAAGRSRSNAGDASRSAFARALTDTSRNALQRSMDEFNVDYRTQAEKSRADDILAQRQNAQDRFRLDNLTAMYMDDILTGFGMREKTLTAHYYREKKNSEAMVTAAALSMLGGLLGMF